MSAKRKRETEVCEIWLDEKGWIHTCFKSGAEVEVKHMQEIDQHLSVLSAGKPFKNVVDLRNKHVSFDPAARKYAAKSEITRFINGSAIVFNTLPARMVVNFFLKFDKPAYPVKAFSDMAKAEEWLKKL
ncbi:MAG: hypothetical protein EA392_09190 [Cryomorphaceae bacterium]|nr:MAG: hypothetical protein EA392_09190 [Cryomorphaceae bacterium]